MAKGRSRGGGLLDRLSFGATLVTVAGVAIFLGWLMGQYAIRWVTSPPGTLTATDVRRFEEALQSAPTTISPRSSTTVPSGGGTSGTPSGAPSASRVPAPSPASSPASPPERGAGQLVAQPAPSPAGSQAATGSQAAPGARTPSGSTPSPAPSTPAGRAPAPAPLTPPASLNTAALADLAPEEPAPPARRDGAALRQDGATPQQTEPAAGGSDQWYRVQVGAFRQREGAQRLVEQLARAGFEAIVVAGDLYRVQVGAFRDEERARNLVAQLQERGFEAIVTR